MWWNGDIGASPKTVVVWSVTCPPPEHVLVQNFTCMNPGDSILHNGVVDYTDKNYRSTYRSGGSSSSLFEVILVLVMRDLPSWIFIFIMDDEWGGSFVIKYGVADGGK